MVYRGNAEIDESTLEDWPFDNPASQYVLHSTPPPRARGRIDHATATTRTGIWQCTVGTMECTEQGDELCTIVSGTVHVTNVNTGETVTLQAGDSLKILDQQRLLWKVVQDVTKVFYGFKEDGYAD